MMLERRRGERRSHEDRRAGMTTDMQMGDSLTLQALHGTGLLTFTLDAKAVGLMSSSGSFDSVSILLTIERKAGQLARVRVEAPSSVKVLTPARRVLAE